MPRRYRVKEKPPVCVECGMDQTVFIPANTQAYPRGYHCLDCGKYQGEKA